MPLSPSDDELAMYPQLDTPEMRKYRMYVPPNPFPAKGTPDYAAEVRDIYREAVLDLDVGLNYAPTVIEAFALHRIARGVARDIAYNEVPGVHKVLGGISKVSGEVLCRFFEWAYGTSYHEVQRFVNVDAREGHAATKEWLRRLQQQAHQ